MSAKIFVGNLPWSMTSEELGELFQAHGTVVSANVITDRETGRSRGFGFVQMGSEDEARKAIEAVTGMQVDGRSLTVNVAHERERRPGGPGGGGGYGGGQGGHGGPRGGRSGPGGGRGRRPGGGDGGYR